MTTASFTALLVYAVVPLSVEKPVGTEAMNTNKPLVQSVIPATLPYHFSAVNTNRDLTKHSTTPLPSININTSDSVKETMTDNNLSKSSLVHMDDEDYQDTKLVITVPASDKEQSYKLLNFTQAGCVSMMNMLQDELRVDPAVMNNSPVISCLMTAIFWNHPCRVGNAQLTIVNPQHFPKQGNGSVYGETPILCNSQIAFMSSRSPGSNCKRSFNDKSDVSKKLDPM